MRLLIKSVVIGLTAGLSVLSLAGCALTTSNTNSQEEELVEEQWYPNDYQISDTDKNVAFRYIMNTGSVDPCETFVICQRIEVITKVSCTNLKIVGTVLGRDEDGKFTDPENVFESETTDYGPFSPGQSATVEYGTFYESEDDPVGDIIFELYCVE